MRLKFPTGLGDQAGGNREESNRGHPEDEGEGGGAPAACGADPPGQGGSVRGLQGCRGVRSRCQACQGGRQCTVSRIGDPVPLGPLDPGLVKNQDPDPGSAFGMNIPDHISESLETIFLG
jgi:hypothetical protein